MVAVGIRVGVLVGVGVGLLVGFGVAVLVTVGVSVGIRVGVNVGVAVFVGIAVGVGVDVAGAPTISKEPDIFQEIPTKTWTSYFPGSHSSGDNFDSVNPYPPEAPFQGKDSYAINSLSLNHKAVHCEPTVI